MVTQKEINQRNYYKHKENGECPRCGKPLDRDGYYCLKCLEKVRMYRRENRNFYRENNICTNCGKVKVPKGERICPECRANRENKRKPLTEQQRAQYNKAFRWQQKILYQQRKEQGICTRCGKRKAILGKKKCGICLQKDAEFHRLKYMDKPNVREYRGNNHLCYYCGNPIDLKMGKICSSCLEKCRQNGKAASHKNDYWKMDNKAIFGEGRQWAK